MKFHLLCLIVAVLADMCKTRRTIEDLAVRNRKRRAVPGPFVEIHVRSEGCNDPGIAPGTCGTAYIEVNGNDHSPHGRGHNVVIVDATTGAVLGTASFDTHGDSTAGNRLRDYLNSIQGDKIVLVAIQDEGSNHFPDAVDALKRVGATDPILMDYRGSFALVGYAAIRENPLMAGFIRPTWIAQQQAHSNQGPSEIFLNIPLTMNVDECANNPCQNGASCVDLQGSYRCDCRPGYSGNNCETDVDECANNPCQNGAACVNLQGSYHCDCSAGYSGNNCEIDVDECANNPCQNGAICVNLQGSYRCDCTSGFLGNNCETDQEPPVLTNCPNDIVIDNITEAHIRVNWDMPTVMDNSGVPPALTSNIPPGHLFAVPGSYEIQYKATDDTGNEATCSFQITLKRKSCFLYDPPSNGALACFSTGGDPTCVVMCERGFDFVFNPPIMYFCDDGVWQYYALPGQHYDRALPWPDCSNTANPSWLNIAGLPGQGHFFDANVPNVQAAIQQNYIIVMKSYYVPPFFCSFNPECKEDNVQVFISTA